MRIAEQLLEIYLCIDVHLQVSSTHMVSVQAYSYVLERGVGLSQLSWSLYSKV